MISQDDLKKSVGWAALKFVKADMIVGVGTGSTAEHFIDALASIKGKIRGAISSSEASTKKLKSYDIPVLDCNDVPQLAIYVDGADEINHHLQMIKGGSAALTREKIIAAMAKKFICIVDESKVVDTLGKFPLPVEVIPIARSYVAREVCKLGGRPVYRQGTVTDNGNAIIDIHDLLIDKPRVLESALNSIVGVVSAGLFAHRPANLALVGTSQGVVEMT